MPFYRIVGFKTLNAFSHVHMEKKAGGGTRNLTELQNMKFGFEIMGAFARARRA